MANTNLFRNARYINQVPELMEAGHAYKTTRVVTHRPKAKKIICTEKKSGRKTTGIVFPSGKVYIGDDVWRLSNRADCCEYPFRGYVGLKVASLDYEIREAESTFPEYTEKNEGRCAACV